MSIAIEAAELMKRFQWLITEEAQSALVEPPERAAVANESADILTYCLSLSNAVDLAVSSAVMGKLQTNELRYPADKFLGRFRRPERERDGLGRVWPSRKVGFGLAQVVGTWYNRCIGAK